MEAMRSIFAAPVACVVLATGALAECPLDALGTTRTLIINPSEHLRIGTMQYPETLPLRDREVVLTFDDGPIPPYTERILDTLAAECVKATFFIVGQQAQRFPELVRRAYQEGHTIATHSQHHPRRFDLLSAERISEEIEEGVASTAAALGDPRAVAPFFRVPGLRRSSVTESYLGSRSMMVWSADFTGDDWRHISARQVLQRAVDRLEAKGKGVLLLHDIQPATALALPDLLKELKARGFRVVHAVSSTRPTIVAAPMQWEWSAQKRPWPRVLETSAQLPVPSRESFGWPQPFEARAFVATQPTGPRPARHHGYQPLPVVDVQWPLPVSIQPVATEDVLPIPSPQSFGIPHPFGPHITLPTADAILKPTAAIHPDASFATIGLP
jgi:peptidoglycan/xylan/chitin deacetylase (PgdA/CDA1 family)